MVDCVWVILMEIIFRSGGIKVEISGRTLDLVSISLEFK